MSVNEVLADGTGLHSKVAILQRIFSLFRDDHPSKLRFQVPLLTERKEDVSRSMKPKFGKPGPGYSSLLLLGRPIPTQVRLWYSPSNSATMREFGLWLSNNLLFFYG